MDGKGKWNGNLKKKQKTDLWKKVFKNIAEIGNKELTWHFFSKEIGKWQTDKPTSHFWGNREMKN